MLRFVKKGVRLMKPVALRCGHRSCLERVPYPLPERFKAEVPDEYLTSRIGDGGPLSLRL
jgi:hypothetical protein